VFLNTRGAKAEIPVQSYPNYVDLRDRNDVLSALAAYRITPLSFSQGGGNNARIWGYEVTGNYFDALGVGASRGRVLHAEDDQKRGGHPVMVISFNFWKKRFNADPDVAGKTAKLNGLDYTIVGVAPPGFFGTERLLRRTSGFPSRWWARSSPPLAGLTNAAT